jgi:outer membrane lipoprotein-sorting protein
MSSCVPAPNAQFEDSSVFGKTRFMTRISPSFRKMTRRALLAAFVLAPVASLAAEIARRGDPPIALSSEDRADLKRIAIYLDGIHTMRAKFKQTATGGRLASGRIYLRRPGLMRVEYDPPVPVLLVADGHWVSYYDRELDQRTQIPISQTPVWFLLQKTIDFTPAVTVTRIERSTGALRVSLYRTENPDAGSAAITFSDNPLRLRQWTIEDSQGSQVAVALQDMVFGGTLSDDLFIRPRTKQKHGQRIVD